PAFGESVQHSAERGSRRANRRTFPRPPITPMTTRVILAVLLLALLISHCAQPAAAQQLAQSSQQSSQVPAAKPKSHYTPEQQQRLDEATKLNDQAMQLYQQAKYTDGTNLAKQALAIREEVLGPDHPDVATSVNTLALLYNDQGNYAEALPLYQRAI